MIREAVEGDIPNLVSLGKMFLDESGYGDIVSFNPFKAHETLKGIIGGNGVVFVAEREGLVVGGLGLLQYTMYFSDDPVAVELFWWMHPSHRNGMDGPRMLKRALEWGKERGLRMLTMVDLPQINSKAPDLYAKFGGEQIERTWVWRM